MNTKAIITSALPYSNGEIHLGHVASTYLPADVTTRFLKQNGVEAYYICASDDFGTPILIQSEKEGKTHKNMLHIGINETLKILLHLILRLTFFIRLVQKKISILYKTCLRNSKIMDISMRMK